jgi:hypothetical protein
MCNTHNVQLPYELLHGNDVCTKQPKISVPKKLQNRALKDKVALIPKVSQSVSQLHLFQPPQADQMSSHIAWPATNTTTQCTSM